MSISQHLRVLDVEYALNRAGGDRVLLRELAFLFLGEYPKQLMTLAAAVASGDTDEVSRSAHTLKGSVVNFGAVEAVHALASLEQAGRNRNRAECPAALAELERVLAQLRVELAALAAQTA